MKIELGKVDGKGIRFITDYPLYHYWLVKLTDDNTLALANIDGTTGRCGSGAVRVDGRPEPPLPVALSALDRTHFSNPLTLRRVK